MERHAIYQVLGLAGAVFLLAVPGDGEPAFDLDGDRLRVRSRTLEILIQGGAVVGVRDRKTDEEFSSGEAWPSIETILSGISTADDTYTFGSRWATEPERYAKEEASRGSRRRPKRGLIPQLTQVSPSEARLAYGELTQGKGGDELVLSIRVDPETGDILLRGLARLTNSAQPPALLDVPFPNLRASSVILGNGARYTASDPPVVDFCMRFANNLYSPCVAIAEGQQGCVAVWPDDPASTSNVFLAHRQDGNHIILRTDRDPCQKTPTALESAEWRIGVFPNWVEAARRYRIGLEKATGARPLWQQTPAWVQNIHAVHAAIPPTDKADEYYADLARRFDPGKLLLFYWNGDGIILFGDHRYMTVSVGRPRPPVIDALRKHGFRWIGYHPYTLIFSPEGMAKQLEKIKTRGWGLPENYAFRPDYDGTPEGFYDSFRPIGTNYYSGEELWVFHPGSRAGRDYLVRNFGNYCRFHRMDGAYMDILGCDHGYSFSPEKKVMDGLTYRGGEERTLREIKEAHKELAIMSEVQGPWIIAHAFYSWEGATHVTLPRQHRSVQTKTDHPLRTALWGSYQWTRESGVSPPQAALLGTLPELDLQDDWQVARCRLFIEEELFNDLPETWDPDALACYRAKDGHRFQFRKLPCGDGYVEITATGYEVRLPRLISQARYPFQGAGRIQDWPAYRNDQPIALSPSGTYPVVLERPRPDDRLRISNVSDGTFITAVRHSVTHTVIEFGTQDGKEMSGRVTWSSPRRCFRVCGARGRPEGPFEAGQETASTTRMPGGLVFVWKEPENPGIRVRADRPWAVGQILRNGIHRPADCVRVERMKSTEDEALSLRIVTGAARGYAEQWVELEADTEPSVAFEVLQERVDKESPTPQGPLTFRVHLNGSEIWRADVAPDAAWKRRHVPLKSWAGRTVLLTFSAETPDSDQNRAGSFAGVEIRDTLSAEESDE